jgi:hypothetical protein
LWLPAGGSAAGELEVSAAIASVVMAQMVADIAVTISGLLFLFIRSLLGLCGFMALLVVRRLNLCFLFSEQANIMQRVVSLGFDGRKQLPTDVFQIL